MFMRQNVVIPTMKDLKERIDACYPFENPEKYRQEDMEDFNQYANMIEFLHHHTVDEFFLQLDKHLLPQSVEDEYYFWVDIVQDIAK